MSSTEYVFIQGKLSWVRCESPNEWGKWTVCVHPTPESLEKIRELQAAGMKNVIKKDDDGYYTTFGRPTQKMLKGKVIGFAPPLRRGQEDVHRDHKSSILVTNLVPFEIKRDFTDGRKETVDGLVDQKLELLF